MTESNETPATTVTMCDWYRSERDRLARENERYQKQMDYLQAMASEYYKMLEKALIIQDKTYGDGVALHLAMIDWAKDTRAALDAVKEK